MISIRASSGTFCLPILASRPLSRRATSLSGEDLAPSNARYAFVRHDLDFLFRVQIQIIRGDSLPSMLDSVHFLRRSRASWDATCSLDVPG